MFPAAGSQHLSKFRSKTPDKAINQERRGCVECENEIVEIGKAFGRIDPIAMLSTGDDLVRDHNLKDGLDDSRHVTNDEDNDYGGQGGSVVGLIPEITR